ncbi:MAG: ABC transporter permease [Pleurocapsa minor GSE-CHR-MK-17-07R]|jgi:ribose/xylose/arabinose/galactoside ABC-type transport system permease subunit|nr:ABC transporter permease [Pleurocapsa minor GSE-CHR-MK 17-07R]
MTAQSTLSATTTTAAPTRPRLRAFVKRNRNTLLIWIVLIIITIIAALISESFTNPRNFPNIMRQSAALMLVGIGQTIIMLAGGIDLSAGSTVSLTVVVMAALMKPTPESMIASVLAGLGVGLIVGFINGTVVNRFKLAPFMVTLATLSLVQGLALQFRQNPQATIPREFSPFFIDELFGVPIPFLIIIGSTVIAWLGLRYTRLGRHIYAVGSNEAATRLSGMSTNRIKLLAFMLSGLLASMGGVFLAARSRAGDPFIGESFAFDAITVTILGGTSLTGGSGSVWGTLAGVWILTILSNVLNLTGVPANWQFVLKGVLLVAAVMVYGRRRAS